MDLAGLVIAAQSGDAAAREKLFASHVRVTAAVSVRILRVREEAEDVAQAALMKAAIELPRLVEPGAFKAWLLKITTRLAFRRLRELRSEADLQRHLLADGAEVRTCSIELQDPFLRGAPIARLPAEERTAFILRYVACLELSEISSQMRLSLATVKRRLAAARSKLVFVATNPNLSARTKALDLGSTARFGGAIEPPFAVRYEYEPSRGAEGSS